MISFRAEGGAGARRSEVVCLAVAQVLLDCPNERRFLRLATRRFRTSSDEPAARLGSVGGFRQRIESAFDTLKDQLSLERHGGRTLAGLVSRIARRCSHSPERSCTTGRSDYPAEALSPTTTEEMSSQAEVESVSRRTLSQLPLWIASRRSPS